MRSAVASSCLLGCLLASPASADPPACDPDDALSEAAAGLLLDGAEVTPEALDAALHAAGSDLTAVRALRLGHGEDARFAAWVDSLRDRADGPLVCGEAADPHGRLVLAAARGGSLDVDAEGRLSPTLAEGFREPRLVLRDADGSLSRVPVERRVTIPEELARPVLAQLVATGPAGPRPVAQRLVGEGEVRNEGTGSFDLPTEVGRLRDLRGASPLRRNRLLDRQAEIHAREVCERGRAAHELEPGADPERRLRREGIQARVVGEVVARASNRRAASAALARSPSHLMTLVDRRFTDGGYAVHSSGSQACAVVLLASWPRILPR